MHSFDGTRGRVTLTRWTLTIIMIIVLLVLILLLLVNAIQQLLLVFGLSCCCFLMSWTIVGVVVWLKYYHLYT